MCVGSPGGGGGTGEDPGHDLWFQQPPSLHRRGHSLCFPLRRRDPRSPHTPTVTPLSRENTVRETRKSCSSHALVGYRSFRELSHLTLCSNALQLSDPYCSGLYCVGGFDVSAIAEFPVGKRGLCVFRADRPFPARLVPIFTAFCPAGQA